MAQVSTPSFANSNGSDRNMNSGISTVNSSGSSSNSDPKNRKNELRSWTWHYFIQSENMPICQICSVRVKIYHSSTTELIKHLATHNIDENTQISRALKRLRLDFSSESEMETDVEDVTNTQLSSRKRKKMEKINSKVMAFILSNNLPFNIVESFEFQDLLDSIKKNFYKLPCRQTVKNTILFNMVSS